MTYADTALENQLRARIADEITVRSGQLAAGAAPDYADYTKRVGAIEGLKLALKLVDDIHRGQAADEDPRRKPPSPRVEMRPVTRGAA